jgi:hypothetical protein
MLSVSYDPNQSNNSWWFYARSDGQKIVVTRCPNGHIGSLDDHTIAADGTVAPSVVCQVDGCDFHEFIHLENYAPPRPG